MFHSDQRSDAHEPAHDPAQRGTMGVVRRGFTLLELMIVLTLLVGLTGLVMPSVLNRLGDSLAASALGQIEAIASECRSQAQQEGRALRLIARTRTDGTVGLYIEPIGESESISASSRGTTDEGWGTGSAVGLQDSFGGFAPSPMYVLPAEFSFSRSLPQIDDGFFNDPSAAEGDSMGTPPDDEAAAGSFVDDLSERPLTLAVYLPEGTAIVERPLYLRAGNQTYAIKISRWTGGVAATLVGRADEIDSGEGGSGGNGSGEDGFGDDDFGRGDLDDGFGRVGSDGFRGGGR